MLNKREFWHKSYIVDLSARGFALIWSNFYAIKYRNFDEKESLICTGSNTYANSKCYLGTGLGHNRVITCPAYSAKLNQKQK